MSGKNILVWFRNDLRIHDNEMLIEAVRKSDKILPVYFFDPRSFTISSSGLHKTGNFRAKFIIESVLNLKQSLQQLGGNLLVRIGTPETVIPELISTYDIGEVYHHREVAFEETQVSSNVEDVLWKQRVNLKHFIGHTLFHKEDLPFPIKDIPDAFNTFRRKVERDAFVKNCFDTPESVTVPTDVDWGELPTLEMLGLEQPLDDSRALLRFQGGETEAIKQLHAHIGQRDLLADIKSKVATSGYSSLLSPWLAMGCLSPREVYWEVKRFEAEHRGNEVTHWLYVELLKRDYFRFMFKKYGNQFFKEEGPMGVTPQVSKDQEEHFERWKSGNTGVLFVDACMNALNATGYINHTARQALAAYLIRDLGVSWVRGAAYFEEKLIDYCPASNWGNWATMAGVTKDTKQAALASIDKYAKEYDPKGEFVKLWLSDSVSAIDMPV